jgi:hypothetical protein
MVSHDDSGSNLPNFGDIADVASELTPLQSLNASQYVMGLRSPITRVRWSYEGMTRRWWIHFENGAIAYIPDTKTLRNPAEMEIIFSDALGFSVLLHPPKLSRVWKQVECNWIMECAENHPAPPGSNMSQLLDLIEDTSLLFVGDGTEEITGRKAARAFAEQANDQHLDRRWVGAKASNGLFLHFASLIKVWQSKYGAVPTRDTLCATLYQASFKPTHPYPTQHAGSRTGAGDYSASVRMWFKPDIGEVFINDATNE